MPMDFWTAVTHLGNAALLLPAALVLTLWLLGAGQRRLALLWAACFGSAVLLVLASKLAFMGWGIGSAALDFTGISGHSTVSTAVFAIGAWLLAAGCGPRLRVLAFCAGLVVGLLVSVSRVVLHTHSVSEAAAGFALGLLAAGLPVLWHGAPRRLGQRWLPLALGSLLLLVPQLGRPAEAHDVVVKMAQIASGRADVFSREMLHR